MLRVLACITQEHDLRLLVLAILVCLLASIAALSMLARAQNSRGRQQFFWLAAGGTVAGCGIWSTHFIAMLAFQPGLPVGYDAALTLASIVVAVMVSGIGFAIALKPGAALYGGAVTGVAIGTMHYIGMAALQAPATASWDTGYVIASWLLGIGFCALAVFRLVEGTGMRRYLDGTVCFFLSICGLHFTGMAAVTYLPDASVVVSASLFEPATLAIVIAAATILIIGIGLVAALTDNHLAQRAAVEGVRLGQHVQELERTQSRLEETSAHLADSLIAANAGNKAKADFLAGMSHELRTPLNAVIGFSDVILSETFGPLENERYRAYITDIRKSGTHLLSLINDLLDLSRLDAGGMVLIDDVMEIAAVAGDAIRMIASEAQAAGVQTIVVLPPSLPYLRGDERRVRQILLNLLTNAVKFTPKAGEIVVGGELVPDGLVLTVRDTGIGIAPENIGKVLERFQQIDSTMGRKHKGAGLGLTLTKELTELHGGRLTLESALGKGTTVYVWFPASRLVERPGVFSAA